MKKNPGRLVLLPIGLIVSLVVLVNTASRSLEKSDPELAYKISPFNTEALLALGATGLPNPDFEIKEDFRTAIDSAIAMSPGEARLLSLKGGLLDRTGQPEAALVYYDRAIRMAPTELFALSSLFVRDLQAGNIVSAVARSEIFLRRWNQRWNLIRPYLPILATTDEGRKAITEKYADFPSGRRFIISALLQQRETLGFANLLLQDWAEKGFDGHSEEFDRLLWALVRMGEDRVAYKLHVDQILAKSDQPVGFVNNGDFSQPLVNNPFGWQVTRQSGVQLERIGTLPNSGQDSVAGSHYLSMKFLGNPLNLRNLSQFARLPAGSYSIGVTYSAHDLKTPAPITVHLKCRNRPDQLLALELASSQTGPTLAKGSFTVPEENCDLTEIYFATKRLPLAWSNRFSGELRLLNVEVTRNTG